MRWFWPLLVAGAILLAPGVRGDPAISSPGPNLGVAAWTFSNPANYTGVNATLIASGASLAWTSTTSVDATAADFAQALVLANVDISSSSGDVVIADTSAPGPVQSLTWQPDPAVLADNYLYVGNGGKPNFGTATDLTMGNWGGGSWARAVLQFPTLPLPLNATLVSANLQLYMFDPIVPDLMYFSAHRMLNSWTEMESNWNTRDGLTLWNNPGGDFDPTALDTSAGVGATPGWFTWNITSLAAGWWTKAIVNDGVMVRQVGDTTSTLGNKDFYSSDATTASLRPRLLLSYTTPGSRGHFESGIVDAGGNVAWGQIGWNATLPAGTSVVVRTRSGGTASPDASWSAWSAPALAPGALIASPTARYLQYSLDLSTTTAASPTVHDVAVGMSHYAATGRVETQDFAPASLRAWGTLSLDASLPAGTSATLAYSQDGGSSWLPASMGGNVSSALVRPIRLRILLATDDTMAAPIVHGVTLSYSTTSGGTPPPPPPPTPGGTSTDAWLAWAAALAALGTLGTLIAALLVRRTGFHPTGLFLIHADGRLIARVGTEEMQDELAASAVFTLVMRFVEDSFRSPGGTGGELKSLQVDEREVSIARGRFLYLALVSGGPRPPQLSARMYGYLAFLETNYGARLERWDGFREGNERLEGDLRRFLQKGYRKGHPGRTNDYRR